jgi:hypothetical protein
MTVIGIVSKFLQPHSRQRDWDEHLPFAMYAYRSTPQASTGESPNMMMLGREANMPVDILMQKPPSDPGENYNTDYAKELRHGLMAAHERARKCLQKSAIRQKTEYDRKSNGTPIKAGDFVWLNRKATKQGMSPKLDVKWDGPFLVINQLGAVTYRIQRSGPRGIKKVVHYDRLKPYQGKTLQSWLHQVGQPEVHEEVVMLHPTCRDPAVPKVVSGRDYKRPTKTDGRAIPENRRNQSKQRLHVV